VLLTHETELQSASREVKTATTLVVSARALAGSKLTQVENKTSTCTVADPEIFLAEHIMWRIQIFG